MPDLKTGPYEILLRFNCQLGETFGQLRGCHLETASYLVDEAGAITGRVETNQQPKDFPPEELVKYLGDQFETFNTQLEKERTDTEAAKAESRSIAAQLGESTKALQDTQKQLAELKEKHQAVSTALVEKNAQLAEASAQIDVMRAEA